MIYIPEEINLQFCQSLVNEKIRAHKQLLFFSGTEFTEKDSSMKKLAKIISACANSGKADIFWGIKAFRGRAKEIEPITNFSKNKTWLVNEIQSHIDGPVRGLLVNLINIDSNSNTYIVHFHIPISNNQPHMFSDNRYYAWKNNKIASLDESEVRSLYNKLSHCELEFLGVYNTNGIPTLSAGKYSNISFYPKFLIRNSGNIVEKDYKIEISFPACLHEESFQPLNALFIKHEGEYVVFGQKANNPIFQEEIASIIEAKIAVNKKNIDKFLSGFIKIKLFFSSGIKTHSIKISDTLSYKGKVLDINDFTDAKVLDE